MSDPSSAIPEIAVAELATLRASAGAVVLDVRQLDEFLEVHVPDALFIPMAEVPARAAEVPSDQTVYVICHSGGRSAKVAQWLRGQGVDAVNVAGGTLAWVEAGHPTASGPQG